ncbi:MAG TPA: thioredoxin family protein, partial [Xanthobacteraceae bacterium]|nr:thioredoxin family protein [Xanthobacteraceae bacterium]
MEPHKIVSQDEWLAARKAHLAEEKTFTRARDALSKKRRELPWVKVDKAYIFDTPSGKRTLADLFGGKSQLIVYHFMLGPDWEAGCPSCSLLADHFDGTVIHLAQRDVAFVVVSRAPLPQIEKFKTRMGWRFPWVSSFGNDFNFDYHVSATPEEKASGKANYNYEMTEFPSDERPGASVFYRNEAGDIFHTYSSYGRGLDMLIGTYHLLDIAPK